MALTCLPVILPAGAREAQADQKAKLKGENRPPLVTSDNAARVRVGCKLWRIGSAI
jgi:hypothetical protein